MDPELVLGILPGRASSTSLTFPLERPFHLSKAGKRSSLKIVEKQHVSKTQFL